MTTHDIARHEEEYRASTSRLPSTPEGSSSSDGEDGASDSDDSQTICNHRDSHTTRRLYRQLSQFSEGVGYLGAGGSFHNDQFVCNGQRWGKPGPAPSSSCDSLIPSKRIRIDLEASQLDEQNSDCLGSVSDSKNAQISSWKYNTELREHEKIVCAKDDRLSSLAASLKRRCNEISFQKHRSRRPWGLYQN
eukprot:CAMPEP_0196654726 /NCGR_PEP_ID=MMETSP1086-20130531/4453_1 /TAXON_ID=77921 /ORGANISM="Cyanoptyche  gloeocystis , Strain SAG4.97" /LENGTH=190 /DNA_ID=CAMNT_0041986649 /DNA_START=54 /DNA_END=626 /DNA_ORIENTATION=+